MNPILLTVIVGLITNLPRPVLSHGRLWEPPGRSTMWRRGYNTPVNYQDNELFCGGFNHLVSVGYKCGICGDPYDGVRENEAGGKYATGTITRTYTQGQRTTIEVDLTANHKGFFEFKICPTNDPKVKATQDCLDAYPVQMADGSGAKYKVYSSDPRMEKVDVILPQNLTCDFCVLQWRYHAGNSWGTDPDGTGCVGCGPQEEFYGCADIKIVPGGDSAVVGRAATECLTLPETIRPSTLRSAPQTTPQRTTTQRPTVSKARPVSSTSTSGGAGLVGQRDGCVGVDERASDNWCQINCQRGFCPATHCQCSKSSSDGNVDTEFRLSRGCRAVGAFAQTADSDKWCRVNCLAGYCPASHCAC